jgi:acetyl-CoA carboxylase biotin carboxyl carrier protein
MEHEELKKLIDLLKDSDVTELQFEKDGTKVRLKREKLLSSFDLGSFARQSPAQRSSGAAPEDVASTSADEDSHRLVTVTAPLVGTFYRSPSPDAPSFVEVGDRVKKGQVICIVEAMKLMNEIECEVDGQIVKILVDNGHAVEYGEPLFLVDPL